MLCTHILYCIEQANLQCVCKQTHGIYTLYMIQMTETKIYIYKKKEINIHAHRKEVANLTSIKFLIVNTHRRTYRETHTIIYVS